MTNSQEKQQLVLLLRRADKLLSDNNIEGLKDLQRTILRQLQSRIMLTPYLAEDHAADCCPSTSDLFSFISEDDRPLCKSKEVNKPISLCEPILTFPWHPSRLLNNLGKIGEQLPHGHFNGSDNHSIRYYWPLMMSVVTGGNHSIAQGILRGEGSVTVEEEIDLSALMTKFKFDGEQWINTRTNSPAGVPMYTELGWAWEIGRLLMQTSTSPYFS